MLYSMIPAAFLLVNFILNWEMLKKYGFSTKNQDKQGKVHVLYNRFLLAANCYFLVDMVWGLFYEHRDIAGLFPFIYSLTVFYFLFMLLTMLTWTRYLVAYIDKSGRRSIILIYGVWIMFAVGVICLILNCFFHFMFAYTDAHEYIGETGRNISFFLQILFYIIISTYMFFIAHKTAGQKKIRYIAVAVTSIVLVVFLTLQIFFAFFPSYAIGLMVGVCLIHTFVEVDEKKEKEIHDHIASAMAEDYEAIFYIDIETNEYLTFSKSQKYMTLNAVTSGKDFFKEAQASIEDCIYPDDWEYAKGFYKKETMLKNLEGRRSFSFKYRVMINEEPRFFLFTVMRESNGQYLIFYEKDIDDELKAEKKQKENQKQTITFGQIAESLASIYDLIYYINISDSSFVCYQTNDTYGNLEINSCGDDFYKESITNISQMIHEQDRDKLLEFVNKDNMISTMETHKDSSIIYRMIVSDKPQYTRMTVRKSSDGSHFIIGIENVDEEIEREKQHLKELKTEKELARRDELTGVKNKTAYKELEESIQGYIENHISNLAFAIIVCDTNNLKQINDTKGHAAGDEYLKASCHLLCNIFVHSPVFRVGGDEFVVFLKGNDYEARYELMEKLQSQVRDNHNAENGVIVAAGMSEYNPEKDQTVSEIFERADKEMYKNKKNLKSQA